MCLEQAQPFAADLRVFGDPTFVVAVEALVRDHAQVLEARLTHVCAVIDDESGALLKQDGNLSTTSRMALSYHGQEDAIFADLVRTRDPHCNIGDVICTDMMCDHSGQIIPVGLNGLPVRGVGAYMGDDADHNFVSEHLDALLDNHRMGARTHFLY